MHGLVLYVSFVPSAVMPVLSFALCLLGIGAGYGTAKAAIPIFQVGITRPDLTIRLLIPVLMAGVIGIFGLIVSLILSFGCKKPL